LRLFLWLESASRAVCPKRFASCFARCSFGGPY
jgi:hypothetical protein